MSDLRSAFRHLLKSPGFTAVAVITLALALGVNSAIFSIVNGLLLRPTIAREPDRVVSVFTARQASERDYRPFSYREYTALREDTEVFAEVTGIAFTLAGIGEGDSMRRALTFFVTDNFFQFSGATPAAGRFFTPEEGVPNANIPVVVVSHGYWQKTGRSPHLVGSTLRVNGHPHTVIGVAPEGFAGVSVLFSPEVWLPLGMFGISADPTADKSLTDLNHPQNFSLTLKARMQPGFTIETARARLPVLDTRLNAVAPAEAEPRALQITPPSRLSVSTAPTDDGPVTFVGLLLCGMAAIVLLIASLNLANLLLARGSARAREIAVRLAVGATRWHIVRQLTVEGLVLAVTGGIVGLVLSDWTNTLLEASFQTKLAAISFSLSARLQPDLTVIAVTFGFCVLATLVFSVGPAWRAARADLVHDLKAQAGDPAAIGRFNRFFAGRHLLVMTQMALSLVLVFASTLFFRGALKASGMETGFRPAGVMVASIDYSMINTPRPEATRRLTDMAAGARALPGVKAAGLTTLIPYGNISNGARIMPANAPTTRGPDEPAPGFGAVIASITPGYLDALGARLLRGRDFSEIEAREKDSPAMAIIDETLAEKLFPGEDALGRQIRYTQPPTDGSPAEMTIVGITNRHQQDLQDEEEASYRLYVPLAQNYSPNAFLCVRYANESPAAVLAASGSLRQKLRSIDPEVPLLRFERLADIVDTNLSLWIVRLGALMFGVFGGIALVLATVGVYGVKAYTVARRTREIGIRMALGARRGDVFRLIMRQGALQILVSTVVGLVLALLVGQVLASMLYRVSPTDPLALLVATVLLGAAALFACWIPARRATRVDPNSALRSE
ncbi:MAG: ABC transporter permease [Opitutaceae bacterium]|nr:ABC transporter permease [Opitutaceae bacterium]